MEKVEVTKVVKVFEREIWIESDIMGSKHVMIQHMDGESPPIKYCTFFYNYAITSNGAIREAAERMAISLGAKEPVEYRQHDMSDLMKKLEGNQDG